MFLKFFFIILISMFLQLCLWRRAAPLTEWKMRYAYSRASINVIKATIEGATKQKSCYERIIQRI